MQRKALEISFALVHRFDGSPSVLAVTAVGKVPSLGWREPRLVPFEYSEPPTDGWYHFDLIAEAPEGAAPEIKSIIVAHFVLNPVPDFLVGVVVHSSGNAVKAELKPGSIYNLS